MERLAQAIVRAAELRENSFGNEAANNAEGVNEKKCLRVQFYKLTLREACNQAAEEAGFDTRGTLPLYLLLKYCESDILEWAKDFN